MLGFNYYRLKAVDIDESVEYFGVKAVKMNGTKSLVVYPNPSQGERISFWANFSPAESDRIILSNQLGVIVADVSVSASHNTVATSLNAGIYILKYISKDFEQIVRVVVTR